MASLSTNLCSDHSIFFNLALSLSELKATSYSIIESQGCIGKPALYSLDEHPPHDSLWRIVLNDIVFHFG